MSRKLTKTELELAKQARFILGQLPHAIPGNAQHYNQLGDCIDHGTLDGKPWVEPERVPGDDLPVTDEWLRGQGWHSCQVNLDSPSLGWLFIDIGCCGLSLYWKPEVGLYLGTIKMPQITTRRQLSRLVEALS